MTDLGLATNILGLNFEQTENYYSLGAINFIKNLIKAYSMENAKPSYTPMENKLKISEPGKTFDGPYRELIGSLMYLSS